MLPQINDLVYVQDGGIRKGFYRVKEFDRYRDMTKIVPVLVRYHSGDLWRKIKSPKGSWVHNHLIERNLRWVPNPQTKVQFLLDELERTKEALEELL